MSGISPLAQILAAQMMPQQGAPPMLADQGQMPQGFMDILKQQRSPDGAIQEINPGMMWAGRDRNVVSPLDTQMYRVYGGQGETL